MKLRLSQPSKLVDIAGISEIKGIREEDGEIVIGAGTTHADIANDDLIKRELSFFAQGASLIGDIQIRNYGTIGGSLAHADPAADYPAVMLALDAEIHLRSARGARVVDLTRQFCGRRYCFPVVGGVLVHRDADHLTQLFAHTLGPFVLRRVGRLLRATAGA